MCNTKKFVHLQHTQHVFQYYSVKNNNSKQKKMKHKLSSAASGTLHCNRRAKEGPLPGSVRLCGQPELGTKECCRPVATSHNSNLKNIAQENREFRSTGGPCIRVPVLQNSQEKVSENNAAEDTV